MREVISRYEDEGHDLPFWRYVQNLIRCKDCTYYQEDTHECGMEIDWFYMPDDGFCSRARRREEDEAN